MKLLKPIFFLTILTLPLLFGCKGSRTLDDFQIDSGSDYFPLELGKYIEYELDSITYDTTGSGVFVNSVEWLIREEVVDTFRDITNRLVYQIDRTRRKSVNENWRDEAAYVAVVTDQQAERIEENLRFIKMVFPLRDGEIWDGNLHVDVTTIVEIEGETIEMFKGWAYEVDGHDEPETINGIDFDEVTTIYQAENENAIELRYSMEKYARGVGLVYREMKILDTQCITDCIGMTWEMKAQKGFILRQEVTSFN